MEEFDLLLEVLEASVKKNGSKPLTTGHLLNILRMVDRRAWQRDCADLIGYGHDDD